ncbi:MULTISPECIES: malto-oligosyltrehalose trehalohydrolase [unclassified Afipia]|uniref:malto-oligosyltrehalose trehalohydrolase n=1 Tax=unclassified Afipia TaxID=2642050 RepID=UPI00041F8A56|nr:MULTISPECIES: malto-oligosyltrehalose trehalohydrolase [unclassified Afipia]
MTGHRFSAEPSGDGVTFNLWAPAADTVDVVIRERATAMDRSDHGWFRLHVQEAGPGTLYHFRIDNEVDVPDPASRFQPTDVAGPSEVIDHCSYKWRSREWRGRPWAEAVFLECHVGTFTNQGTYLAMIDKLDHLAATGITALELMPIADFPGRWNWGYDGVLWYAPDSTYGRPDDLKTLIDEAHLRGLMVFLDVVYNHFGPEGNYLSRYAPTFFSSSQTPWGNAIDYRQREVRQFAIENALHWIKDYRFDGLRLDAVDALTEPGEPHLLNSLSSAVGDFAKMNGRHVHLVLENDDNIAGLLNPSTDPPRGQYRAQWNDDYHHGWHVLVTGETHGYYSDYLEPEKTLIRSLGSGFAYQGEASVHRNGVPRGESSGHLSPLAFVNFLQNHDQIGNRALGDRLGMGANPRTIEAALAITLLCPMPPLMFMGEEWGATSPFPFFCDFSGHLADAVRRGRREEFQAAYEQYGDEIPDPLDEMTFKSARLDWSLATEPAGKDRLQLVRRLLAVRHAEVIPHLAHCQFDHASINQHLLVAQWRLGGGKLLCLTANLSDEVIASPTSITGRTIWGKIEQRRLLPWNVVWWVRG